MSRKSFSRNGTIYSCPVDYDFDAITAEDLIHDSNVQAEGDDGQVLVYADDRTGDDSAEDDLTTEHRAKGLDVIENEDGDLVLAALDWRE